MFRDEGVKGGKRRKGSQFPVFSFVMDHRQELRQKLRAKIKSKREGSHLNSGPQLAQRLRDDPTSAMLALGVDDADMLNQAKSIVRSPETFLKKIASVETADPVPTAKNSQADDGSDEEAAPPAW